MRPFAGCLHTWEVWYLSACELLLRIVVEALGWLMPRLVQTMLPEEAESMGWDDGLNIVFDPTKVPLDLWERTAILWVPVVVALLVVGYSSLHNQERRLHCVIPVTIGGIAVM